MVTGKVDALLSAVLLDVGDGSAAGTKGLGLNHG